MGDFVHLAAAKWWYISCPYIYEKKKSENVAPEKKLWFDVKLSQKFWQGCLLLHRTGNCLDSCLGHLLFPSVGLTSFLSATTAHILFCWNLLIFLASWKLTSTCGELEKRKMLCDGIRVWLSKWNVAWVVCINTFSVPVFYAGTKIKAKSKFDFQTKTKLSTDGIPCACLMVPWHAGRRTPAWAMPTTPLRTISISQAYLQHSRGTGSF